MDGLSAEYKEISFLAVHQWVHRMRLNMWHVRGFLPEYIIYGEVHSSCKCLYYDPLGTTPKIYLLIILVHDAPMLFLAAYTVFSVNSAFCQYSE